MSFHLIKSLNSDNRSLKNNSNKTLKSRGSKSRRNRKGRGKSWNSKGKWRGRRVWLCLRSWRSSQSPHNHESYQRNQAKAEDLYELKRKIKTLMIWTRSWFISKRRWGHRRRGLLGWMKIKMTRMIKKMKMEMKRTSGLSTSLQNSILKGTLQVYLAWPSN